MTGDFWSTLVLVRSSFFAVPPDDWALGIGHWASSLISSTTSVSSHPSSSDNMEDTRKRARTEEPKSLIRGDAAERLQDPIRRNAMLNELLRLTSSHDLNVSLPDDSVLVKLTEIAMKECLDWNEEEEEEEEEEIPTFSAGEAWISPPTKRMAQWLEHCQSKLLKMDDGPQLQTLDAILVILRNLAFVSANHRLLVYSPRVLMILVGCLYDPTDRLALSSLTALQHLAGHLDVSGQKLLNDRLFYTSADGPAVPDSKSFGITASGGWGFGGTLLAKRLDAKEEIIDIPPALLLSLTRDYLVAVWALFPAMGHLLTNTRTPRTVLLLANEFLLEVINSARIGIVGSVDVEQTYIPSLRSILVHMPDAVLNRLTDFLFVPRLGSDGLDYVDPVKNVVTRVNPLKVGAGYDATVDTEIRDRALDALVPLLELDSPRMAARVCGGDLRTGIWDAIVPILSTNTGRQDATLLATQLLRELSKAEENRTGLMYIQERVVLLAGRDNRIAHLTWNQLYPPSSPDELVG